MSRSFDQDLLLSVFRLCAWLVLLTVTFVPLERLFALHPPKIFRKSILTDVAYYFPSSLIPGLLLGAPLALVAWLVCHAIPGPFTSAVTAWPAWLQIVAALGEIGFYWGYGWSHEISIPLALPRYPPQRRAPRFLGGIRAHPVDMVFTRLCGLILLYVLGLAAPAELGIS